MRSSIQIVTSKVDAFQEWRSAAKKQLMMRTFMHMVYHAFGAAMLTFIFAPLGLFLYGASQFTVRIAFDALFVAFLLGACVLFGLSTFPVEVLNVDSMLSSKPCLLKLMASVDSTVGFLAIIVFGSRFIIKLFVSVCYLCIAIRRDDRIFKRILPSTFCVCSTTAMAWGWGLLLSDLGRDPNLTTPTMPNGIDYSLMYMVAGWTLLFGTFVAIIAWFLQRLLFAATEGESGSCPTVALCYFIYSLLFVLGAMFLGCFILISMDQVLKNRLRRDYSRFYEMILLMACVCLGGPALIMLLGRDFVFLILSRRFEKEHAVSDGAFMAELLDGRGQGHLRVRRTWYVHHGRDDPSYPALDYRRNWSQGKIRSVTRDIFIVALLGGSSVEIPIASRTMPSNDLMQLAAENARCIDWESITRELMTGAICGVADGISADLYNLSRPLGPGEVIDFFMSHSWHDDAERKWSALNELASKFRSAHGRYPTFWLDKVCIDQACIADGLKVLPIYVMACESMLVLSGHTYPNRLWCAWELCTFFAFMSFERALERLILIPLSGSHDDAFEMFRNYDVMEARCYDPNEEARLQAVITAVGAEKFNHCIRRLAMPEVCSVAMQSIPERSFVGWKQSPSPLSARPASFELLAEFRMKCVIA